MQKRFSLIVTLIFLKLFVYSQSVDSLKILLKAATNDTTRCNILSELIENENDDAIWPTYNDQIKKICENYLSKNPKNDGLKKYYLNRLSYSLNNIGFLASNQNNNLKALEYYLKSLNIQEEINDKEGIAVSLNNIGAIYINQGNTKKALEFYLKSLKIFEETNKKEEMTNSLNNIGLIYKNQGNIPEALDYYHRSLKIKEEIKDEKGIANSFGNIAGIYEAEGDIVNALNYNFKSLKIREKINDKNGIANSLNNIGAIYKNKGEINKAFTYFTKSLKIAEEIKDKRGIAYSLNNLGNIYQNRNDFSTALSYFHKSLKIREEINDRKGIAYSLDNIALALFNQGNISEANVFGENSLKIAQELGFPENIQSASLRLSKIYSVTKNWNRAYQMHVLYKQMSDSISNEKNRKASIQKGFQYEYDKKAAADSVRSVEEHKVFDAQMKQEKTQRTALYIGIGLIALFSLFMYNRFRVTRKQKYIIEEQKGIVEKQKHLVEVHSKEISDSINYAERIQRSLLASKDLLNENLKEYFVFFKPKDIVSGDFYWASKLSNNQFLLITADSTGHGVPGAIMSMLNISCLKESVKEGYIEPSKILNNTRQLIIETLKKDGSKDGGKDGMDCSLISFDFNNNQLTYSAANNPIWIVREKSLIEFSPNKMPIGKHERDTISFTQHTIDLQKNDMIYTFTDGMSDQFGGPKGKKFMYKQLKDLLISISQLSTEVQQEKLNLAFLNWKGKLEQIDDVCVIGVRV